MNIRRFSLGLLFGSVLMAASISAVQAGGRGGNSTSWALSGPGWSVAQTRGGGAGTNTAISASVPFGWGWGGGWGAPGWGYPGGWGPTCCSAPPVVYVGPMLSTIPALPPQVVIIQQPQVIVQQR